jgi:hydrogenase maturation protease
MSKTADILIIGIGNPYRSDDAAGRRVARNLFGQRLSGVRILECSGEATELMQAWNQTEHVLIIDAICSGQPPGSIQRFDVSQRALPACLKETSTHAFGLSQAIELARVLNTLPKQIIVFGIEGKNFEPGETLSHEIQQAVDLCVQQIQTVVTDTSLTERPS